METSNLDANVDMARLVNDAFVMVDQIVRGAQHNPLMNDEPIIVGGRNVGGHLEQAVEENTMDAYFNMLRIGGA